MVAYFRERTRLWAAAGIWTGVLLTAFNVYAAAVTYVPQYRVRNDFRLMYGAALDGWTRGYGHLYDLAAQRAAVEGLGPGTYWSPYLNPPPLAWLVTPFLALRFDVAVVLWTALLFGAALLAWWLAAPGSAPARYAHLALFVGLFPTAYGLMVGQPVVLVVAVVAASWWLAERRHDLLAGLVLSLIVLKPQLALLVPLCLLVAGRGRIFGAWLAASAVIGAVALVMLGGDGVQRYRDALSLASQWEPTRRYAIAGPLGLGPQVYAVEAAVVLVAAVAAWRRRRDGLGALYATGIVASLLFTPYVGFQDFAMLMVSGWLLVRSGATSLQVALLVLGYCLLELALIVLAVPILLAEAALLITLAASTPRVPASAALAAPAGPPLPENTGRV